MAAEGASEAGRLAADTADAVLKAGASVARTFAQAVSGRPQPVVPGEPPLAAMLRHTSAGVGTVARIVVDAARAGAAAGETPSTPQARQGPVPAGPVVAPGSTLRIPLSIDNPGESAMTGLVPRLVEALHEGSAVSAPPVRFEPLSLSIGPRDFEKLVVLIDVPPQAAEGSWLVAFSLDPEGTDGGGVASEIGFRVKIPEQAPGPAPD